jgi:olfactory receptor
LLYFIANIHLFYIKFNILFFSTTDIVKEIIRIRNHTVIPEFILLSISDNPELQVVTFIFLFVTYLISVTGNLNIIMLTSLDSRLKTPMYFFLQNFSFLEIIFMSVSIHRFFQSVITKVQTISYNNCLAQLFFFISMVCLNSFF